MRRLLTVLLLSACASSSTARFQGSPPEDACGSSDHDSGTIEGHLIADSAGILLRRGVHVDGLWCVTVADSAGQYRLTGLAPGEHMLGVGDLGVRKVRPIPVRVGPDSTTVVDIHLRPENLILDCQQDSHCAAILAPLDDSLRQSLTVDEQVLELALRTAVAVSGFAVDDSSRPGALCVGADSGRSSSALSERVLRAIGTRLPTARQATECKVARDQGGDLRTPEGLWAWFYKAEVHVIAESLATSTSSYYVGPLWAAGWLCTYRHGRLGWRPTSCRLTWIS